MKKYRAIFFDWDGTAVINRNAPVDQAVSAMRKLLEKGVYLLIISGTTYENIGGGSIEEFFTNDQLRYLYFGLGRGSQNYGFNIEGKRIIVADPGVSRETEQIIHDVAYDIHRKLFHDYGYNTDIVFNRPNYVKIDIMTTSNRETEMFLSRNEIVDVKNSLAKSGFNKGLSGLIELAMQIGEKHGLKVKATCDAKYLEIGVLNKADNVNAFVQHVVQPNGIAMESCCFWGDEFLELDDGITGSDSFMYTEITKKADFFDVGMVKGNRPAYLTHLGGSVNTFLSFLDEQSKLLP